MRFDLEITCNIFSVFAIKYQRVYCVVVPYAWSEWMAQVASLNLVNDLS